MVAAVAGLEPRRRVLRIFRVRALQSLSARALTHFAAPPSPQKTQFFGDSLSEAAGFVPEKHKIKRSRAKSLPLFLVVVTGLEPRRRVLRIFRIRALQSLSARALTHFAAPPFPRKTPFSGDPFTGCHRFCAVQKHK